MPTLQYTILPTALDYAQFFLAWGDDLEWDWAYLSSQNLHVDYFKYRLLPKSKRDKFKKIAETFQEEKIKLIEKVGPLALNMM